MAVVIRMKQMGRTHRHYYRIVAIDKRQPRDGRVIEELGSYDPHVADKTKRVTLVIDDGVIAHVLYPVFPPDRSAADVVDWLKRG